jgi:hypothetical protein
MSQYKSAGNMKGWKNLDRDTTKPLQPKVHIQSRNCLIDYVNFIINLCFAIIDLNILYRGCPNLDTYPMAEL